MVRLSAILGGQPAASLERTNARAVLRAPWCWPSTPTLQEAARRELGIERPPVPGVGEVCLVSVDGQRASLWWLRTRPAPGRPIVRQLIETAHQSAKDAWARALRDVPFYASTELLRAGSAPWTAWRAEHIVCGGAGAVEQALNGESFGLALALASSSLLLDAPCPPEVISLAALDPDGRTRAVDDAGLVRKLATIVEYGLGVSRVLVAPGQGSRARALAPTLDVVEVPTLRDAIAQLWPDVHALARAAWTAPGAAVDALADIYRIALENTVSLGDWAPVAESARLLAERLGEGSRRRRAEFARLVAQRHAGALEGPMDLPSVDAPSGPGWVQELAHAVQSYPDSSADLAQCRAAIEHGRKELATPHRRQASDLELLGAIGRALAAVGDHAGAESQLRAAIEGWRDSSPEGAPRPVCELVRIIALGEPHEAAIQLEAVLDDHVAWLRRRLPPEASVQSMCFLALAVGRALITVGQPARGLAELADSAADWSAAPAHVLNARLRWQARGHIALGELDAAAQRHRELELRCPDGAAPDANPLIARVDQALARELDPTEPLGALRASAHGHELGRFEAILREAGTAQLSARDLARRFSDHYRY